MKIEEFKELLINSGITSFKSKQLSIEFEIKLYKVKGFLTELRKQGVVKMKSVTGNCTSICGSCYEYGCDAGPQPPINYWIVTDEYLDQGAVEKRRKKEQEEEYYF